MIAYKCPNDYVTLVEWIIGNLCFLGNYVGKDLKYMGSKVVIINFIL